MKFILPFQELMQNMNLIGIKYCGGCNPHIDRKKLIQEIEKLLPPEYSLTTKTSFTPWDIGVMVCGCPTACADKPEFKIIARKWIVVAGNSVDLNNAPEEILANIVTIKITKLN
jgi:hypothetical protein